MSIFVVIEKKSAGFDFLLKGFRHNAHIQVKYQVDRSIMKGVEWSWEASQCDGASFFWQKKGAAFLKTAYFFLKRDSRDRDLSSDLIRTGVDQFAGDYHT